MRLIVISNPTAIPEEVSLVIQLFENGLVNFHVNKPDFSGSEIDEYIQGFPVKYQSRIFRHSNFPKFHSLEELATYKEKYDYAFLSPIFDSISKRGYKSKFRHELHELPRMKAKLVSSRPIIALGGIDEDKIETCRELGFAGVAVCGAIWQSKNPLEKFLRIRELCQESKVVNK